MDTKPVRKQCRRRLIVAGGIVVAALVLASAVLVGSGAVFTATSANPDNVFTAGTLTMSNDKDNAAILALSNMKPGDIATGSVVIANTGSISGDFSLSMSKTSGTAPSGGDIYDTLELTVMNGATVVYGGDLAGFTTAANAGTIAASDSNTYDFTVTFPDSGDDTDNVYQGSSTEVEFTWTAVQS